MANTLIPNEQIKSTPKWETKLKLLFNWNSDCNLNAIIRSYSNLILRLITQQSGTSWVEKIQLQSKSSHLVLFSQDNLIRMQETPPSIFKFDTTFSIIVPYDLIFLLKVIM